MARPLLLKGCLGTAFIGAALILAATAFIYVQAQRVPSGRPDYVAMGSSFAAGAGLGPLQSDSPLLCARSINGYPQQLARLRKLSIVDMSCGGALTRHLLHGGQFFQGPQIRAIGHDTKLVTITVGGNDSYYIADLSQLAARNSGSPWGRLVKQFWGGPKRREERDVAGFRRELATLIRTIHSRAPSARIVVVTYPTILPPAGTCPRVGLNGDEASAMRRVGNELAAATLAAARQAGAVAVDMNALGRMNHPCSAQPWTRGWTNGGIAPFHPTQPGAEATARAISAALDRLPDAG